MDSTGNVQRNFSRLYFLSDQQDNEHAVCKIFFLQLLGYISDKVIIVALKNCKEGAITPSSDKRGKHIPANKIHQENQEVIINHINFFNPSVSHYRREHAPNRLYHSPELKIKLLLHDFKEMHPEVKVSFDRYKKEVVTMNISFVKLGEEECEDSIMYENHEHGNLEEGNAVENCDSWKAHVERANVSRKLYKEDAGLEPTPSKAYFSVDMQKAIMLLRIPGVKKAVFTNRLVTFHETFAPFGRFSKTKGIVPTGVIWHEGISGRNAEDVASTFEKSHSKCSIPRHKTFFILV